MGLLETSQERRHSFQHFGISVAQKDEFFLPILCSAWRLKKTSTLVRWHHLNIMWNQNIDVIMAYSVGAAASCGRCSRGNSFQTLWHCNWALTRGRTGPCSQSRSEGQNQDTRSKDRTWELFTENKPVDSNIPKIDRLSEHAQMTSLWWHQHWPLPAAHVAGRLTWGQKETQPERQWWWRLLQSETREPVLKRFENKKKQL